MNAKRKTANAKRKTANAKRKTMNAKRKTAWNGGSFTPKATIRDSLAVALNRRQDRTRLHSVSALSTTARRAERCLFLI